MPGSIRLEVSDQLDESDVHAVAILVERAAETQGVRPLSEHVMMHLLRGGGHHQTHVCAWRDESLIGYDHLDRSDPSSPPSAELAIDYRKAAGTDVGGALLDQLLIEATGRLQLWCLGARTAGAAVAESRDFTLRRTLYRMRRPLGGQLPSAPLPDGMAVRTFDPGRDSDDWLDLNARAFAELPDQGGWKREDLERRLAAKWFDPDGFLLAHELSEDGTEGRLAGFHWTKIHGESNHGHKAIGEVYVLGVDPELRARGLGRALTIRGLQYLQSRGLAEVMLYVESSNAAAIRTYERLGFRRFDTDYLYVSPGTDSHRPRAPEHSSPET